MSLYNKAENFKFTLDLTVIEGQYLNGRHSDVEMFRMYQVRFDALKKHLNGVRQKQNIMYRLFELFLTLLLFPLTFWILIPVFRNQNSRIFKPFYEVRNFDERQMALIPSPCPSPLSVINCNPWLKLEFRFYEITDCETLNNGPIEI